MNTWGDLFRWVRGVPAASVRAGKVKMVRYRPGRGKPKGDIFLRDYAAAERHAELQRQLIGSRS